MNPAPIALTCGEPGGIGLELAAKAWAEIGGETPFFLIGDSAHFEGRANFARIASPEEAWAAAALPILQHDFPSPATPGFADPKNAQAVIDVITLGVELTKSGAASALTTLPINKKVLIDGAAFPYPGHTEYLAALAEVDQVVMMLACPELRVVPATIHIALADVPAALTVERLESVVRITRDALIRDFAIPEPRLALAGLNPHAGEGGAMGREEIDFIAPLVDRLQRQGIDVRGPLSADTMFHAAARKYYDVAICMYHDQALIPIKTIDFAGGVNVTLGLAFVRTSPDHGTALDIAGRGLADPTSLIAALRMAARMADAREK